MNQDEIDQKFKSVREKVEQMAKQQEAEIGDKVETIRENASKKFSNAVSSN